MTEPSNGNSNDFASKASAERVGVVTELLQFLSHSKKWWLGPIVIAILVLGALVLLGGTAAAPFIYTLF